MAQTQRKITNSGFTDWKASQLPDLTGKHIVITGGNSGLGLETAKILISNGANITITSRSQEKAIKACADIGSYGPGNVDYSLLDLSNLDSVHTCAEEIKNKISNIDILINNAGIMMTPQTYTSQDHELQLATNHLGHFYLNALLFENINKHHGRIVVVSSIVHKNGKIHFEDLMLKDSYTPMKAYAQSKLANLMYAFELNKRLKEKGSSISCIACHPGYSNTNLQSTGPTGIMKTILGWSNKIFAQDARSGALPTVLAAAGKEAQAGAYYGPQSRGEFKGPVGDAKVAEQALDPKASKLLWETTERLVNHSFNI